MLEKLDAGVERLPSVDHLVALKGQLDVRVGRPVFVEEENLNHLTPLATLAIGVLGPIDALLQAFRGGGGVPYEAYGADTRKGIAALNRPMFVNQFTDWFASIPEVDARLRARPPARVADLACGTAWSSIAIARASPEVSVDAIDLDAESIQTARTNVVAADLADRVRPKSTTPATQS